jgi:Ca-activated chloride channel homolog
MHWENPSFLLALWLIPVVVALLIYARRKRSAIAARFAAPTMLGRLMPATDGPRPWLKGTLLVLALSFLIVAAARPRFGIYFEEVSRHGADIFVCLDVSKSMMAEDVSPNRLKRAKSDIRDLLSRVRGDRVGLIVFAGKPVVKVPLTTDQGFYEMMLERIDTGSAPLGGTAIGDAIRKAITMMPADDERDRAIVMITDGEDHESMPFEAARQAAEKGIKIFTVGLGNSTEGSRIPIRDEKGNLRYMQYAGKEIWSKVDEATLKKLALESGGAYIPAGTKAYDLGQIYEDHLANLKQAEFKTERRKRYREQFQLFAAIGVILLLVQMSIPQYARPNVLVGNK